MAHHVGSQPPRWLHMAQDGSQEASKMAHNASKTAHVIPKTPPDEPRKAKIIENPMVFFNDFYDFAFSRHRSSKSALDGPKTAQNGPGTVPRRP